MHLLWWGSNRCRGRPAELAPQAVAAHTRLYTTIRSRSGRPLGSRREDQTGDSVYVKVKAVCAACSSGWMSGMESAAQPTFGPWMRGEALRITPSEKAKVAGWAMKTAIMLHYAVGVAVSESYDLAHGASRAPANTAPSMQPSSIPRLAVLPLRSYGMMRSFGQAVSRDTFRHSAMSSPRSVLSQASKKSPWRVHFDSPDASV